MSVASWTSDELAHFRAKDVANGSDRCRECGCTTNVACFGGCYWVEPGLCSSHAGVVSTARTSAVPAEGAGSPPAARSLHFFVAGAPITQGSKKAFVVKGRAVIVDDTDRDLKSWRTAIAEEARRHGVFITGPIALKCHFALRKPASRPRRDVYPQGRRNDCDKLLRAVMDALTGVVFVDDGDIVLAHVTKGWAPPDEPTGVLIDVAEMAT